MEPPPRPSSALFDVYLRLRPSNSADSRFLTVEERDGSHSTHITVRPLVNDNRKRAIERFAFTQVFEEDARQKDIFKGTGIVPMIEGVLGAPGCHGRDGLIATLGVTGSGKVCKIGIDEDRLDTNAYQSHTILGTKSQRGLVQMTIDALFQSCDEQLVQSFYGAPAFSSLAAADVSEANMFTASAYLDSMYGDNQSERFASRTNTPAPVSLLFRHLCFPFAPLTFVVLPFSSGDVWITGFRSTSYSLRPSKYGHSLYPFCQCNSYQPRTVKCELRLTCNKGR